MSVIVKDEHEIVSLVTKGALEEMLTISSHAEYQGVITPLTDAIREEIFRGSPTTKSTRFACLGKWPISQV